MKLHVREILYYTYLLFQHCLQSQWGEGVFKSRGGHWGAPPPAGGGGGGGGGGGVPSAPLLDPRLNVHKIKHIYIVLVFPTKSVFKH